MGSNLSFDVGADSIAEPGQRSIMCEGIDTVDADKLFAAFEAYVRDGKTVIGGEAAFEVAPHEGGFLDVHKYEIPATFGGGSFTIRNHYAFDAKSRTMTHKHYQHDWQWEQGRPFSIATTVVHDEPTKIEHWMELQPQRMVGKLIEGALSMAFKELEITAQVKGAQPSIATPDSLSAVSEEIAEAECSPDDFLEKFKTMLVDKMGATELPDGTVIEDRSGTAEFLGGFKSFAKHNFIMDAGRVETYEYGEDESLSALRMVSITQVHKSPFRVEAWTDSKPGRFASETELRFFKPLIEKVLTSMQEKA